jgi:hypothetical protein
MPRKILFAFFLVSSVLVSSSEVFAQRIKAYPSRMSSGQNYSYYRYHRRVVSSPRPVESIGDYPYPVQTVDGGFRRLRRVESPPAQIFEEEIREELRTWPSQASVDAGPAMDALEREVADLRSEVRELSRKIELSLPAASQRQSGVSAETAEKMEKLKQELRELKALLEQLRKEK